MKPSCPSLLLALLALGALVGGCRGPRDVLAPASLETGSVSSLWWLFCGVAVAVFLVVMLFLLGAIRRAQRDRELAALAAPEIPEPTEPTERRLSAVISSAVGITIVILFGLLLVDFSTGRKLRPPVTANPLTIKITGHQWWWQIDYDDPTPANIIHTANELHLPVGRPVQLQLQSADVIHSFWLPNLQGKKDLIPGHPTTLWLQPDRVGTFRGQCAEFCGHQHAHMGIVAVVESPEDFAKWQEAQRKSAPEPASASQRHGRDVFLTASCVMCHAIGGTTAGSHVGPPLTHFASRETLAAGAFPNNRGYLAGWILDPQALKPGVRMPQNLLSADDLQALLDYLETLR
jgi:cytochrome c oxidase subunit 2